MRSMKSQLGESKFCEFRGASGIFSVAFVIEGKLLAGVDAVDRVGNDFVPQGGGALVVAAAFGHLSELAAGTRVNVTRQAEIDRLNAGGLSAVGFTATKQEAGEAEEVEAGYVAIESGVFPEKRVDFGVQSSKPAQIHLIVADDAYQGPVRTSAQIVEVKLRDESRSDVVFAVPAEARRVENVTLEFDQAHGAEAELPDRASRMEKVKMRSEPRSGDGTSHGEAAFEERPIERFSVEGDENGTLGDAGGQFVQQRVFVGEIAHEKLFDLKTAGVPPAETHQESIGAGAAGEAGGFGIEEEPLRRIGESGASATRKRFIARVRK